MPDIENFFLKGTPIHQKRQQPHTEEQLYWHMYEQGKKRFGANCTHKKVVSGTCTNCLRKVVA